MPDTTGRIEEQVSEEHASIGNLVSTTTNVPTSEHTAGATGNDQVSHLQHEADHEHHPFALLTFVDPAPMQESSVHPGADRSSSPPALKVPQPSIKGGPTFDPVELHQVIFPAELPPRPLPKRNFFARIFKRQERTADDIELGSRGPSCISNNSRQLQRQQRTSTWGAIGMFVLFMGVVGFLGWSLMTYKEEKPGDVQTS